MHFGVGAADRRRCLQDVVDGGKVRIGQRDVAAPACLAGSRGVAHRRWRRARPVANRPGDGQLADRDSEVGSQALKLRNDFQVTHEAVAAENVALAAPVLGSEAGAALDCSGQQTVSQRPITITPMSCARQYGNSLSSMSRRNRVVGRLYASTGSVAETSSTCAVSLVRHAHVPDLALRHEICQSPGGFGGRELGVRPVHQIHVDVVDAERAEAGFPHLSGAIPGPSSRTSPLSVARNPPFVAITTLFRARVSSARRALPRMRSDAQPVLLGGVEELIPSLRAR